ncbi:hypothetical protein [Pelagibacterium sp. H642]|uniref:hypothetical protein n=1 Tax=Pelagibacterium sp. H642 TaxID=1881069 RepID=UPI002814EAF8|nr:hypothetical protein [Pelagibacterium sp. H642]WMT92813.1 hypothetical protein NO934_18705 [Pelagibacterium sp. H642]
MLARSERLVPLADDHVPGNWRTSRCLPPANPAIAITVTPATFQRWTSLMVGMTSLGQSSVKAVQPRSDLGVDAGTDLDVRLDGPSRSKSAFRLSLEATFCSWSKGVQSIEAPLDATGVALCRVVSH